MTSKVDLAQFKTYNNEHRKFIFSGSPKYTFFGTISGSQLSFLSQGVSFSLGKVVSRRSGMTVFADSLRKGTIQRKYVIGYLTLLHFLKISQRKGIHEKGEKNRIAKKGRFPASSIISKEMRKFFGGAGNPTWQEEKHTLEVSTYA